MSDDAAKQHAARLGVPTGHCDRPQATGFIGTESLFFSMHPHGLVSLTSQVNATLGTLAAKAALNLDVTLQNLTKTFLLKRYRAILRIKDLTAEEGLFLIGLAPGNAGISEIQLGMLITNTIGPEDVTQTLSQDEAWKIYRNTLQMPKKSGGPAAVEQVVEYDWIDFPGRGIPAIGGTTGTGGFRAFIYNADTASLTTGATVTGLIEYQGVWLRD